MNNCPVSESIAIHANKDELAVCYMCVNIIEEDEKAHEILTRHDGTAVLCEWCGDEYKDTFEFLED